MSAPHHLPVTEPPPLDFDPRRTFVRVTERRPDGLVAFEFSIGWPELSVELLLPEPAFDEFCSRHRVRWLPQHDETPGRDEETNA